MQRREATQLVANAWNASRDDSDRDENDDVVVVTSSPETDHGPGHAEVMGAMRYLLNRHELSTGTAVPQTIAIVSPLGNEGVTTVSRSLAAVLSARTQSGVCWLDLGEIGGSDRSPATSRAALEVMPRRGRRREMTNESNADARPDAQVSQKLERWPSPVYASGPVVDFEGVVEDLSERYRHVIFDTPPLLTAPDSLRFMQQADAYIMVARYGVTTRNHVRKVHDELQMIPTLGAVLNGYRTRTPRFIRRFFPE